MAQREVYFNGRFVPEGEARVSIFDSALMYGDTNFFIVRGGELRTPEPRNVLRGTATSFCVMPATRFNGYPVGNGQPGPITRPLIRAWSEAVGVDLVAQAEEYARRTETWAG